MAQENPEDSEHYRMARKRVEDKVRFFRHVIVYVVVNALLSVFNIIISPDFLWFVFPFGVWTIAILTHFLSVFVFGDRLEHWRRREIEKEMKKAQKKD